MEVNSLKIEPPSGVQFVLAQSHFIKTVEDVSECLVIVFQVSSSDVVFVKRAVPV
jgi:adenosine/AMP kinase